MHSVKLSYKENIWEVLRSRLQFCIFSSSAVSFQRNERITICKGEYIAFLLRLHVPSRWTETKTKQSITDPLPYQNYSQRHLKQVWTSKQTEQIQTLWWILQALEKVKRLMTFILNACSTTISKTACKPHCSMRILGQLCLDSIQVITRSENIPTIHIYHIITRLLCSYLPFSYTIIIMIITMIPLKSAIWDFYNLLTALQTISNMYAPVPGPQPCTNHMPHRERVSHVTCRELLGMNGQHSYKVCQSLNCIYFSFIHLAETTNRYTSTKDLNCFAPWSWIYHLRGLVIRHLPSQQEIQGSILTITSQVILVT